MTTADTMLLGLIPTILIICAHVLNLHWISRHFHVRLPRGFHRDQALGGVLITFQLLVIILGLHALNVVYWSFFSLWVGAFPRFEDASFFVLENYTGLGLTRIQIPELWRSVAVYISLTGVICLAWSTSVLVSVNNHLLAPPAR